jgi:mannose-6-phosphate isomerase
MSAGEVMAAAEKAAAAPGDQRMEKPPAAVEVLPAVQNYDWGVRGGADNGLVARMANAPPSDGIPFAELWMGTHPKAPLTIVDAGGYAGAAKGMLLSEFLKTNKEFAGEKTVAVYGDQLPYLFKCLSVDKALSIQAHPNKTMAEQLHAKDPANYPDANHKPEMACAVTDFEGLCGFRPLSELAEYLTSCPELRVLVSEPIALQVEAAVALDDVAQGIALKQAFATVMSSASDVIKAQAEAMVARIECKSAELLTSTERLILRINAQFPGAPDLSVDVHTHTHTGREGERYIQRERER